MVSKKLIDRASKITMNIDGTDYVVKNLNGNVANIEQLEAKFGKPRNGKNEVQDILVNDFKKSDLDDIF